MMDWVWDALKMLIAGIRQEGITALLILLLVAAGIGILEKLKINRYGASAGFMVGQGIPRLHEAMTIQNVSTRWASTACNDGAQITPCLCGAFAL